MDLSADGRELLILTCRHAYLLYRSPAQDWKEVLIEPPLSIKLPDLFTLAQREAACFAADGQRLFVTGEGAGAALLQSERQWYEKSPSMYLEVHEVNPILGLQV